MLAQKPADFGYQEMELQGAFKCLFTSLVNLRSILAVCGLWHRWRLTNRMGSRDLCQLSRPLPEEITCNCRGHPFNLMWTILLCPAVQIPLTTIWASQWILRIGLLTVNLCMQHSLSAPNVNTAKTHNPLHDPTRQHTLLDHTSP